ncbi:hypothetical protein D3C81_1327350 [compost metagenome]
MLGEVSETARQDRGFVAQTLELGKQGLGALGQAQRGADLVEHANIQALEQGQTLFEAGAEVQLTTHGPFGDFRHLLAHASGLGQLVDHFGLDQGRVHIEHRQTAVATEQRVLLEGDVDVQLLGHAEELGTQGLRIGRLATDRKLDATLALLDRRIQSHTAGKTVDMVDVQPVLGGNRTDPLQLFGSHLAGQQSHDVTGLALTFDPALVVSFGNRRETDLLIEFVARKQNIFQNR